MTEVPSTVTAQAELAWIDEPDCNVLWVNDADSVWIVTRDGRAEGFAGRDGDDKADALARRWSKELGGSWKYAAELEMLRKWRAAGSQPEDKPQRWSVGFFQRPFPQGEQAQGGSMTSEEPGGSQPRGWRRRMGMPDLKRCEASLSAAVYRKRSKADDTYDHHRWLQYDGNHVRCKNSTRKMHAGPQGLVGVCLIHSAVISRSGAYFPHLEPGEGCRQPCCREDGQSPAEAGL